MIVACRIGLTDKKVIIITFYLEYMHLHKIMRCNLYECDRCYVDVNYCHRNDGNAFLLHYVVFLKKIRLAFHLFIVQYINFNLCTVTNAYV